MPAAQCGVQIASMLTEVPVIHASPSTMFSFAILTISDKGAAGLREDESGALLIRQIKALPATLAHYEVIPDDQETIRTRLVDLCDDIGVDLVVTTGGTGLSPRDVTPEATLQVIDRPMPGVAEIVRMEGYRKNPRSVLSRAVSGIRGRTLIINLPGSPRAVSENLEILLPLLPHALEKLKGDPSDCADCAEGAEGATTPGL
jgi:molybdenum cofactor synthesis domain-containing protein